jgi:acyl dehydratase
LTGDASASVRKGIFIRSTKGFSTLPVEVAIERGRIRFFSEVLGETDPIHTDLEAARAAGHPDLAAPPSFFMVIEAMGNDELRRRGERPITEVVGCDYRYLLHGEETYAYSGLVIAGDALTLTTTVLDFFERKGGTLEFVSLSSVLTHPERGVIVRTTRSLLHRLG